MRTSPATLATPKSIALFVFLSYGIAWVLWMPMLLGPDGLQLTRFHASIPVFTSLGTIGPMLAAFLATRIEAGRWAMPSPFLPSPHARNWLSLLTGPALIVVAFVVLPYMLCVVPGHRFLHLSFLAPLLAVWPNILGGPLEEEFGWRGYLLPRIATRTGNTPAAILVGAVWATWHLPLMLAQVWGISFWYFLPLIVAVAIFASLAYFATGQSILAAIAAHYVFNTCSTMLGTALAGQPLNPSRDGNQILLLSMIGVALLTIAATQGRLGSAVGT